MKVHLSISVEDKLSQFMKQEWGNASNNQYVEILRLRLHLNVLNPYLSSPGQNFSLQYQYNIKQAGDMKKEKYQLGDYFLIQYQILQTNIARIIY